MLFLSGAWVKKTVPDTYAELMKAVFKAEKSQLLKEIYRLRHIAKYDFPGSLGYAFPQSTQKTQMFKEEYLRASPCRLDLATT